MVAHMEGCEDCQRVLAAGASSVSGVPPSAGPSAELAPGSTLSRYVVQERIGQGAMGVVYAAHDPQLERRVAIKLLRPEGRQLEVLRRRLLREAQALARLSDPHVVAVHDVGTCGDGVFVAMDLVEGCTLAEWLREPRPWREVLRVFLEAGQGLVAAHAAGLVHRDFKPANVLVGRDGRARVTDFGLACSVDEAVAGGGLAALEELVPGREALTRTGALLGTPLYMAPEQLLGRKVDALSDQFSFCVALHEALYGVRPFEGATVKQLAQAIQEEQVRPAGRGSQVPARVRRVVLRGLRPEPEQRFASMAALLEAARTAPPRRARLWLAASVLAAGLMGVGGEYALAHRRADTVQHAQQMVASLEGLEGCKEAPSFSVRPQPPEALRPRVDAARRKLAEARVLLEAGRYTEGLAVTSTLLQQLQGLEYRPLEAEVLLAHGQFQGLSGHLKEAEENFYRALWAAEAVHDEELVARAWIFLIWVVGDQAGRTEDAERVAQHARASVERLGPEHFPAIATELSLRLGFMMLGLGRLEQADSELTRGLELSRKTHGPDSLSASYFVAGLGRVRTRQHRSAQALELYRQAEQLREHLWGPEHPALALNLNNIAIELLALGRREEAVATWRRSLRLLEATRPPDHPSFAAPLTNLAVVQRSLGQLDEARRNLERALAIFERSKGKDHPNTASALSELGMVAYDSQQLDEARASLLESVQRVQRALGPDSPRAAPALAYLGQVELRAGSPEESRRELMRALQLWEKEGGPEGASVPTALRPLARLELATGAPHKALEDCERALKVDERVQGAESPDVALDLSCLAEVHLARGAPEQAVPLMERARRLDASAPRDPLDEAWNRFLLARSLGEQHPVQERSRAIALAEEARQQLERLGLRARVELRQVAAWQRRREAL